MNLSKLDYSVLAFIKQYFKEFGHQPTHVAIANEFGRSRQWATMRIDRLKKHGKLLPARKFGLYIVHFD